MKKKNKINIPEDQKIKCNAIIHSAAVAAGSVGAGLAQAPLADNLVITPIQIGMIIALGKVFDQEVTKSAAKAIIGGASASFAGRAISQVIWGWIPLLGNGINTLTASSLTEAIGWMAVDNFSKDQYADILMKYAKDEDEIKPESTVYSEVSENTEDDKAETAAENLTRRAQQFLDGKKNRKTEMEEYRQLLNEIERALLDVSEDDPLHEIYDKLTDL